MHYSTEPRDCIFLKSYGFLSFVKNMGKNLGKNISFKCFRKSNSKIAEPTGNLIVNILLIKLKGSQNN